ncbi:histidine phosphatase family protein [Paenibacillus wulumuqiensis]|uniref:histidine phosphatase family protein n=1 Tax=Paenibacillus wulumuqiensis TaxID=1567107 RepID=UPI0006986455|nr:histidine phosphatase family protein [Paenibacillus wulumuqiensis]
MSHLELVFIRHGQAEHNLPLPDRLNITHPHLTELGRQQIRQLQTELLIGPEDLFLVSPMVRTMESAEVIMENGTVRQTYVCPAVGPRMYPQNPEWTPLPCDRQLTRAAIQSDYPAWHILHADHEHLWNKGINTMPEEAFSSLAAEQLNWITRQTAERVIIITHDGTIQSYRAFFGEQSLTREDLLGEAEIYRLNI